MNRNSGHTLRPPPPEIVLIAAVARNGAIGRDNGLLFNDPADQRHFRETTLGCPVLMGRRTWESLPARFRPLPGRRNIVVTRNPRFSAAGAETAGSLHAALALVAEDSRVFIIGGAQLYSQALPSAHRMLLTEIDAELPGDTFFPRWDRGQFEAVSQRTLHPAEGPSFSITDYRRR